MITSVLLAGGRSKRMGRDKAFLQYNGKTFLRNILEKLDKFSSQIIISINRDIEDYRNEIVGLEHKIKFVKDKDRYEGPLNAIVSCSPYIENNYIFLSTCDTPLINVELIFYLYKKLKENEKNVDCLIPVINGKYQPLNTFYLKKTLKLAEESYLQGNKSLFSWIDKLKKMYIYDNELSKFDKNLLTYFSINTPELYKKLLNLK
jgi:molybdopterin-guanine dinucleotide biosynthesis protein A